MVDPLGLAWCVLFLPLFLSPHTCPGHMHRPQAESVMCPRLCSVLLSCFQLLVQDFPVGTWKGEQLSRSQDVKIFMRICSGGSGLLSNWRFCSNLMAVPTSLFALLPSKPEGLEVQAAFCLGARSRGQVTPRLRRCHRASLWASCCALSIRPLYTSF
jgi:hypothetical protein